MASNQKVPWTVKTFREKKTRGRRVTRSLSLRQKRADYKCVQKLVDFQYIRENQNTSADCSKLPTPRPFHTPKPRCNLTQKFNKSSKKLEFDGENRIWESRGLSSWENYADIFRSRKCNLISMEDVECQKSPKISTLNELLKQSKESSSDSGHAESNTESPLDTLEQLSDVELFMSSDSEDFQGLRNCENISSDEEFWIFAKYNQLLRIMQICFDFKFKLVDRRHSALK